MSQLSSPQLTSVLAYNEGFRSNSPFDTICQSLGDLRQPNIIFNDNVESYQDPLHLKSISPQPQTPPFHTTKTRAPPVPSSSSSLSLSQTVFLPDESRSSLTLPHLCHYTKKHIFQIDDERLGFRYAIADLVNPGPYPTISDHLASHQLASNLDRRTLPRPGMHCILRPKNLPHTCSF